MKPSCKLCSCSSGHPDLRTRLAPVPGDTPGPGTGWTQCPQSPPYGSVPVVLHDLLCISSLPFSFPVSSALDQKIHIMFEPRSMLTGAIFSPFLSSGSCSKIAPNPCCSGYYPFSMLDAETLYRHWKKKKKSVLGQDTYFTWKRLCGEVSQTSLFNIFGSQKKKIKSL